MTKILAPPPADGPKRGGLKVPFRLQRWVIRHVLRNTAGKPGPTILGVYGRPGEGKTLGVLGTLRALGTGVMTADATMFESAHAGEPPRLVKELYEQAAAVRAPVPQCQARPTTLFLDDAHLLFGRQSGTQYTVNTQLVHGLIQGLCDDPSLVFGRRMPRIPIFMTFNDLGTLPASLRRPGRMTLLHWAYTLEERVDILGRIFPSVKNSDLEYLVCEYVDEPIAFFADLRCLWADRQFRYDASSVRHSLRLALAGKWAVPSAPPTVGDLLALAREVVEARGRDATQEETR